MKKIILKLKAAWKKETPQIARLFQAISVIVAFIPTYYSGLPVEFQQTIPTDWLKYVSIIGFVCAICSQFFTKKEEQNNGKL